MKERIFLLSEHKEVQESVQSTLLKSQLKVEIVDKQHLVSKIYSAPPSVILIDVHSFTNDALLTIQSTLAVEYIPTICILATSDASQKADLIQNSIHLPYETIAASLCLLIRQAVNFMNQYCNLTQTYDTMDIMNEEFKPTMDYFIRSLPEYEDEIVSLYLKAIYLDNFFLLNQPKGIWLVTKEEAHAKACLFTTRDQDVHHEITFTFAQDNSLIFSEFVETGFIRNLNLVEYSDANSLTDLLPEDLLKISRPLTNVVGFGINHLILLAFDYNQTVSKFEVNILKALAIKIDLMKNIKHSMKDVEDAFVYTMNAIARAAEGKDDITGHHLKRVNLFTKILAEALELDFEITSQLEIAAQMHDVGKIYIDEKILSKPGKLSTEEFDEMKRHTLYGQRIIGDSKHLKMANEIARSHHEKYDGSGYPDGKKGEEIPQSARIVALADVYDALRSKRTYKPAFTHQQTYDIIVVGDGRVEPFHFDPFVLEAFKKTHLLFETLYNQFSGD